jgi:CRISPR-associated protein Cas6
MTFIEIQFELQGKSLPADHGYSLYSAVKKNLLETENPLKQAILEAVPSSEEKKLPSDVLISTISGIPNGNKMITLTQSSVLCLRCPASDVRPWYSLLQNQVLNLRGHLIRLIQPRLVLPQASPLLKSRLVTFKLEAIDHSEVPSYFLESCKKALDRLEIKAQVYIDSNEHGDLARRALKIKEKHVIGYGVVVEGLSDEDSIKLQCQGLGGRKHFGCGWFHPVKENNYET